LADRLGSARGISENGDGSENNKRLGLEDDKSSPTGPLASAAHAAVEIAAIHKMAPSVTVSPGVKVVRILPIVIPREAELSQAALGAGKFLEHLTTGYGPPPKGISLHDITIVRNTLIVTDRPDFPAALSQNHLEQLCGQSRAETAATGRFVGAIDTAWRKPRTWLSWRNATTEEKESLGHSGDYASRGPK
jgi:hypothetical protein